MTDSTNRPNRRVQSVTGGKRLLVLPVTWIIRVWLRTLRIELSAEAKDFLSSDHAPMILSIWHNRLMVTSELRRRFIPDQPVAGLVSASKDGAWLAYLFEKLGIQAVRGSTSFRGKQAFRELVKLHQQGIHLALTPDGPRGPLYHFHRGVSELAKVSQAPLLLLGIHYESCWKLSSWDQFRLPKPWSRVKVSVSVIGVEHPAWGEECPEQHFQKRMLEMNRD